MPHCDVDVDVDVVNDSTTSIEEKKSDTESSKRIVTRKFQGFLVDGRKNKLLSVL